MIDPVIKESLRSVSDEETRRIGERIGNGLGGGDIIALAGRLGSGKTCLSQGIARGLGIREEKIVSPTYILIREVKGRVRFIHVDLYRVKDLDDLENAGFYDVFDKDAVTVIEWADRFPGLISEPHLEIRLDYVGDNIRDIVLEPHGDRYGSLVERLVREIRDHQKAD